jgi:hypothetical protein
VAYPQILKGLKKSRRLEILPFVMGDLKTMKKRLFRHHFLLTSLFVFVFIFVTISWAAEKKYPLAAYSEFMPPVRTGINPLQIN